MKILLLDNYDSFVYNLKVYILELGFTDLEVHRNDCIDIGDIDKYDCIVLSPGPGIPDEAGILKETIKTYAGKKSIFGVCLGHQAIGEVFGAQLDNLADVFHGIQSTITIKDHKSIFAQLPEEISVGRYHSWVIDPESLSNELLVTAVDESGQIMAVRHIDFHIEGVQFHPESILSPEGKQILLNFFREAEKQIKK